MVVLTGNFQLVQSFFVYVTRLNLRKNHIQEQGSSFKTTRPVVTYVANRKIKYEV